MAAPGKFVRKPAVFGADRQGTTEEGRDVWHELLVGNHSHRAIDVTIRKRKSRITLVSEITRRARNIAWAAEAEQFRFALNALNLTKKSVFRVIYQEQLPHGNTALSLLWN